MEKLEKHIKEKLEERKITPSSKAWEQIESSLGAVPKKTNIGFYGYVIAASLIGLLVISALYFNSQDNTQQQIEIVDVDDKEKSVLTETKQAEVVESSKKENAVQIEKEINKTKFREDFIKGESFNPEEVLAVATPVTKSKKENKKNVDARKAEDLIIDKKVEEVLATVINLESKANQVTEAEIDSLLLAAQQEVLKERIFQQDGKVDAMALLNEVETELDQTFRNKIFEKLKEGFFKARTAVADRNN